MTTVDQILIAAAGLSDADMVKQLLVDDFPAIAVSTEPSRAVGDFVDFRPRILLLAFKSISQAEDYYLGLYRNSPLAQGWPHRTVLLCTKDDVRRAYELCKSGRFDDYVLFWPMSFDAPRLQMAIRGALRDLGRTIADIQRSDAILVRAGEVSQLESRLGQHIAGGTQRMDVAEKSLQAAEGNILAALDAFGRQLSAHSSSEPERPREWADLQREIERMKTEDVEASLASVSGAMQSVRQWSSVINDDVAPQIAAARALQGIAADTRPYILVVEDDLFQHTLLRLALKDLGATLGFATSGADALAVLPQRRPDLILMDYSLPGMEGVDVTRQIKSVREYSKIPIIMITGRAEKAVVLECLAAGAADFVIKPFEREMLLSKVRRCLQIAGSSNAQQPSDRSSNE